MCRKYIMGRIYALPEDKMKTIGIDIGTTTISAVVLETEEERVLEARTIQNGSFIKTEHEWEKIQDASMIISKSSAVLDDLLNRYPDTVSIGLTGQMHGIVYVDGEGSCISPLYTWQDQRGNLPVFDGASLTARMKDECGAVVSTGYGLVTHIYQCRRGGVPEGAVRLCTIPDYLGMVLTGRKKPLLHISMAASLGFFDGRSGSFRVDQLEQLGIDSSILPEVTDDFSVLGFYKGRPVTVALGDNQASFLGSVGLKENTVLLNVGTGSQISVLSDQYFETAGIEARPLTKGKFILVGASLCGGRAYAIMEKFFRSYASAAGAGECSQYEVMANLAARDLEDDPMKVRTTFNGTRMDSGLRGSITNLSEDNFTPEGMVRGVLTGIAEELYGMFESIRTGTGIEAHSLVASGNGVRKNEVLQHIFEEMFGAGLVLARYEEEAACGAAISSLQGSRTSSAF